MKYESYKVNDLGLYETKKERVFQQKIKQKLKLNWYYRSKSLKNSFFLGVPNRIN